MAPRKGERHSGQFTSNDPRQNKDGRPRAAAGWRESLRNDETLRKEILKLAKGEQTKAQADHVKYLLDQGFGRAPQTIELSGTVTHRTALVDFRVWVESVGLLEEFEAWISSRKP